jgi:hypothetical protein
MKKTLRAVGAAGLAAATIVTGLSFGPAAAHASSPSHFPEFQFVVDDGTSRYIGARALSPYLYTDNYVNADEARKGAAVYEFDSSTRSVRVPGTDQCLIAIYGTPGHRALSAGNCDTAVRWYVDESGYIRADQTGSAASPELNPFLVRDSYQLEFSNSPKSPAKKVRFAEGFNLPSINAEATNLNPDAGNSVRSGAA